ncbi:MAG TPA: HupE/UreJ family protein, partial [Nitrosomonas sp.]|nr:HupE/UreJ family protein [Nitrosomonas sp.]
MPTPDMRFFTRYKFIILLFLLIPVSALAHGISEEDKLRMLSGGYLQYIGLGATHMLTGYDHLLFLFGVVFFLTSFKDIAKFVTAFTVGHCITLIFATFYQITWNYFLIDAIIALSVIYKGFDNNGGFQKYLDMKSPNLLGAVFLFGLLHGFGLSTRLQQLPLGDDSTGILLRILSFNLGVEIGQIVALVVMVA